MHQLRLIPTLSDLLFHTFNWMFSAERRLTPTSAQARASEPAIVSQPGATSLAPKVTMNRGTVHLQLSDSPLMRLNGPADARNYLDIIDGAYSAYRCSTQEFTIDFEYCADIETAGLFALHTVHTLFRGETPRSPEDGWGGYRSMVARNWEAGLAANVVYRNADANIQSVLSNHHLM